MTLSITHTPVYCLDLDKSLAFYTEQLGFEVREDVPMGPEMRWLTVAAPGASPFELQAGRGLRFEVQGQPGLTAEFELDEAGTVVRLVAQPLGIFRPKT